MIAAWQPMRVLPVFFVDNTKRLGRVSLKISQVTPVFLTRVRMVYAMGRKQTSTAAEASALHAERIKAVRPRPIVRAGSAEMVCVPRQHAKTAFSMAARPVQTVAAYARVAGQDPDAIPAMIARAVSAKMEPVRRRPVMMPFRMETNRMWIVAGHASLVSKGTCAEMPPTA